MTLAAIAPQAKSDLAVRLTIDAALKRLPAPSMTAPKHAHALQIVAARMEHIEGIHLLIAHWAAMGENLPRSRDEITEAIGSFGVALQGVDVVGCGSIHIYSSTLAEIRSLGVDPKQHGSGIGSKLVKHFVACARRIHLQRVFVLTRAPAFFERNGFRVVSIETLPEKVFKDCLKCTKRDRCDEIAMICDLTQ